MVESLNAAEEAKDDQDGEPYDGPDRDAAEQRILESALSIEVREAWHTLGNASHEPAEYCILLTTGGPALQLTGTLNEHGEPETAELQMQDWGVPWQTFTPKNEDDHTFTSRIYMKAEETLLTFARCFYFGE
jgi:hypothetical protein